MQESSRSRKHHLVIMPAAPVVLLGTMTGQPRVDTSRRVKWDIYGIDGSTARTGERNEEDFVNRIYVAAIGRVDGRAKQRPVEQFGTEQQWAGHEFSPKRYGRFECNEPDRQYRRSGTRYDRELNHGRHQQEHERQQVG